MAYLPTRLVEKQRFLTTEQTRIPCQKFTIEGATVNSGDGTCLMQRGAPSSAKEGFWELHLLQDHELSARPPSTVSESVDARFHSPQTRASLQPPDHSSQHIVEKRDLGRYGNRWGLALLIITTLLLASALLYRLYRHMQKARLQNRTKGSGSTRDLSSGGAIPMHGAGAGPTQQAMLQQAQQGDNVV